MTIEEIKNAITYELQSNVSRLYNSYPLEIGVGKTNEMPSTLPCIWIYIEPKEVLASGLAVCKVSIFCCSNGENSAIARVSSLRLMERTSRIIIDLQLSLRSESFITGFDAEYSDFSCSFIEFECYYELEMLIFNVDEPIDPAP